MREIKRCYLCDTWGYTEVHHIFFGRANRKLSDKYKLTVDLCPYCHREGSHAVHKNKATAQELHEYGQRKFMQEQNASIADFVRIFGKNYLDEEW